MSDPFARADVVKAQKVIEDAARAQAERDAISGLLTELGKWEEKFHTHGLRYWSGRARRRPTERCIFLKNGWLDGNLNVIVAHTKFNTQKVEYSVIGEHDHFGEMQTYTLDGPPAVAVETIVQFLVVHKQLPTYGSYRGNEFVSEAGFWVGRTLFVLAMLVLISIVVRVTLL